MNFAETSNLSKIENAPYHPMAFFADIIVEAKNYTNQKLFHQTMCIASLNEEDQVLNRNVIIRSYDESGLIFVTERNSRKYNDMMKNSNVAATILWIYQINEVPIIRQIRVNGQVKELTNAEIAEFYKTEPLFAKIRCKICKCGEPVIWDDLKKKHDAILQAYRSGSEPLLQNENYTALRICPEKMDFYYTKENEIADRIFYTKEIGGGWTNQHIAA